MITDDLPEGYIAGLGRDHPHPKIAHLYQGDYDEPGLPMCRRGYNREGGRSYSIWRGQAGVDGYCKTCVRRARQGLAGVPPA